MVDWDFYIIEYLQGKLPTITASEFGYWTTLSENVVNNRRWIIHNPKVSIKRCVCHVAEYLFDNRNELKAGDIVKETNASYSYTLFNGSSKDKHDKNILNIMRIHLRNTEYHGLLPKVTD